VHADGWILTAKMGLFVALGIFRFVGESRPSSRRYRLLQLSSAEINPFRSGFTSPPKQNLPIEISFSRQIFIVQDRFFHLQGILRRPRQPLIAINPIQVFMPGLFILYSVFLQVCFSG